MKYSLFFILFILSATVKADSLSIPKNCRYLSQPKQAEDLLYQFYKNKDTNCLFVIDLDVLERIWKIPVLDLRETSTQTREERDYKLSHLELYSALGRKIQVIRSETMYGQIFKVHNQKNDSSLFTPDVSFPRGLPKPKGFYSHWTAIGAPWVKEKDYGVYKAYYVYAWHGRYANLYLKNSYLQIGAYGFEFTDYLWYPKHNF